MVRKIITYCFIFILGLETIARIEPAVIEFTARFWNENFMILLHKDALGYKPKPYGRWRDLRLNKYGFNDSDEYTLGEEKHTIRILCLGDSQTMGLIPYPKTWPGLLEENLRGRGLNVKVINAGVALNNHSQIINRFEKEYLAFKPRIILINRLFSEYVPKQYKEPQRPFLKKISKVSAFIKKYLKPRQPVHLTGEDNAYKKLISQRKRLGVAKLTHSIPQKSLSDYRSDMRRLIDICRQADITLVFSSYPCLINQTNRYEFANEIYDSLFSYPWFDEDLFVELIGTFNNTTREIAKENNVLYVDITEGLPLNKKHFLDSYHMTLEVNRKVAQNYAEVLEKLISAELNIETISSQ